MYSNVAQAIEEQDYETAQQLLNQIQKEDSENPWFLFYTARLEEAKGNLEIATQNYKELLRQSSNPKIVSQARQGLGRIKTIEENSKSLAKIERQDVIAQLKTEPNNLEQGMLILEPVANELKQTLAQKFAQIIDTDVYSARLQLPSRAWRLYRTGPIGEMRYYQNSLREASIPCFSASLGEIKKIQVYQIKYFQSLSPKATAVYETKKGEEKTITFEWTEVKQRVEGLIPIFEECVEMDAKRKLQRKTKTLDYVQLWDLHLSSEMTIIRLCDQNYQFQQGSSFSVQQTATAKLTTRDNWNQLNEYLKQQLPNVPIWSDFSPFAQGALDFSEMLKLIEHNINLLRREETPWDAAFHLYSSLAYLKN